VQNRRASRYQRSTSAELEAYRHPINHTRQFRDDGEFLVSTDDKEVYVSEGRLVKAWLNVGGKGDDSVSNFRVLTFLKRLDKLAAVNPTYLPRIHEYGLAARSSSMYLVTDVVDGTTWTDAVIDDSSQIGRYRETDCCRRASSWTRISHGDIHPGNVMLDKENGNVFLIDIPDFSHNTAEARNHRYSPENIDGSSSEQRDIFAVLRMSCELLGIGVGRGVQYLSRESQMQSVGIE
jgi:serine/threonine protein kinase